MSLKPEFMVSKYKVPINREAAEEYKLLNASGEEMKVLGTVVIYMVPDDCRLRQRVEALVRSDLKEPDILLSWEDMQRPIWGLLPESFQR